MIFKSWVGMQSLNRDIYDRLEKSKKNTTYAHYTTPEGILGIFSKYLKDPGEKINVCTMRASQIFFLNDAEEYEDGRKFLIKEMNSYIKASNNHYEKDRIKKMYPENIDVYNISFCKNADLLSQWICYGKKSGIAIKFNLSNIKYQYWEIDKTKYAGCEELQYDEQSRPLPILYTSKEKKVFFKELMELKKNYSLTDFSYLASFFIPFCKNSGFACEEENRQIFYMPTDYMDYGIVKFNLKYNVSSDIIKPALDVDFWAKDPNENIVDGFVVGPGNNQEQIYNALIHMFDRSNFKYETKPKHVCSNGVVIEKSAIPFRT